MQSGMGNAGGVQKGGALASAKALEGPCSFGTRLESTVNPESERSPPCHSNTPDGLVPVLFLATSCCCKVVFPPIYVFIDFICRTRWALALSHQGPSAPQSHGKFVLWIKRFGLPCSLDQTCDPGNRWSVVGGTLKQRFCQVYVGRKHL